MSDAKRKKHENDQTIVGFRKSKPIRYYEKFGNYVVEYDDKLNVFFSPQEAQKWVNKRWTGIKLKTVQ